MSVMMPFAVFAEGNDTPEDDEIVEEYVYTQSAYATLSIVSNNANCSCSVTGYSGVATKITVTLVLQKKTGNSWSNIYAKGKTFNSRIANFSYTYNSLSSGTYRTKLSAKVYSGNDYENVTAYSSNVSC